jgi:thiamine kinase-like enzyme
VEPERIAERVWPGGIRSLEPLGGGITNRNFKVTLVDGAHVVLRVGGKDTELLGIDRDNEHAATRAAAEAGLAPEVVAFVEPEGYLVTRFVDGGPVPVEDVRRLATLREIAGGLRRFHDGPAIPGRFDSFRVVEAYCATATGRGVALPPGYAAAKEVADRIESARGVQPPAPCHNDLLNANFIDDGARIRIVDWEYAGMGDPFFDLGNFSINHELDPDADAALLEAYAGEVRPADLARITLMRVVSDFREAMWGVLQQGISTLDVDFVAYAAEHFDRLLTVAGRPAFERALTEAAAG